MISEGLCDTEGWSNDAEKSGLHPGDTFNIAKYSNNNQFMNCDILQY